MMFSHTKSVIMSLFIALCLIQGTQGTEFNGDDEMLEDINGVRNEARINNLLMPEEGIIDFPIIAEVPTAEEIVEPFFRRAPKHPEAILHDYEIAIRNTIAFLGPYNLFASKKFERTLEIIDKYSYIPTTVFILFYMLHKLSLHSAYPESIFRFCKRLLLYQNTNTNHAHHN